MSEDGDEPRSLPYDKSDPDSIIKYSSKLTGNTLSGILGVESGVTGGTHAKGRFGQLIETQFFHIDNNNRSEPDFREAGLELKSSPIIRKKGDLAAKERLILNIINYEEVPVRGFKIFEDKNSNLLIVFYLWSKDTDVYDYPILKVVHWSPSKEQLRIIREDWKTIQGYVMRGEAHLLSEKHTKYLAACRKGAGGEQDDRTQPFSDEMAKQRALSFKAPFVTSIFNSSADVGETLIDERNDDAASIFSREWDESVTFEEYVLQYFERFKGMTCAEIEADLGHSFNSESKQYMSSLTLGMMGIFNKKHVREFEDANISIKTIPMWSNGTPKESMSFPAIKYDEIVNEDWEDSEFYEQIDREFFFPVYMYPSRDTKDKRELVFVGAFFWKVPDEDLPVIETAWIDTRDRIDAEDFDHFIKSSDCRIIHIRPHGRDKDDCYEFRGKLQLKRSFWFNAQYMKKQIKQNLKH